MSSTTYTPLRDDTSYRSLSNNERTFLHTCATGTAKGTGSILRTDGRHPGESRPIRLKFSRAHNMSECTVQLGANTRVSSSVTCHLIPPTHTDRPNDGSISFSVDLSPMSAMGFEYVQPASTLGGGGSSSGGGMGQAQSEEQRLLTNRILRILERTLLNGGAIDAEALCVQSGKWVWRLHIDVTLLDHGGNLVDACVLSAVAALRHFRKPEVQITENDGANTIEGPMVLHSDEKEPTPLPMHHTPLSVTFALFSDPTGATTAVSGLIDPSHREELVMNGNTTFSFNKYGEMCSLDFAGGCELNPRQLITCANLGKKKCVELCNILENSLLEADETFIKDRLDRLKIENGFGDGKKMPLPPVSENVPFVERTDYDRDAEMMEIDQEDLSEIGSLKAKNAAIIAAEEESYRIQALDYATGHVAAKVKENNNSQRKGNQASGKKKGPILGGSLMAAMLMSANESKNMKTSNDEAKLDVSNSTPSSSNRTEAADLEMEELVAKEAAKQKNSGGTSDKIESKPNVAYGMDDDEEEEEETTTLQSEFSSIVKTNPATAIESKDKSQNVAKPDDMEISKDDDDLDLSMAIKSKKKKKSKKSK
mmetsp:Transcript_19223/g.22226  ORF Transcript_19223/g.22226 Transcript_19223/m.22226 type:complete len:595 (-) Transcript_19223:16-1800(-)